MNEFARKFLLDALKEATALREDMENVSLDEFEDTRQFRLAAERSLEIIGEALRRAMDKEAPLAVEGARLREWIALRNVISHQYDGISNEKIWQAATVETGDLIETLERLLAAA